MDLLVLLAEHAGSAVSKDEILDHVWKSRFVGESALTRSIAELRQLLGDNEHQPQYIETLPKRGYRVIAAIVPGRQFAENRLAILPFENLNHDPDQEYLADGITDLLTTELARIGSLHVISRQSVLHLKRSPKKVPDIGADLHVDAIVEGSVLRAGERLRITAQLVRVEQEQHLWAESYECELADILTVQAKVARAIAEAIHATVTPTDVNRLERARTVNPEAQAAYLKARYYFAKVTMPDFQKGMAYLQSAIEQDPSYAPAYEGMASTVGFLGLWGFIPHQEAYPRMKQFAMKALELDEDLSEAHVVMAWVGWFDWDMAAFEREIRRALELNRNSVDAHIYYAVFLATAREDRAGALGEVSRVLELDPLSPYGNSAVGWPLLLLRDYESAIAQASRTLEMYPDAIHALYVLGCAKGAQSMYEEAIAAFERVAALSPDATALGALGQAYAKAGRIGEARKLLDQMIAKREREYVADLTFVFLYCGLGEMDQAFDWLEKCYRVREPRLLWLRSLPLFDPLRSDARFGEMLDRLGLRTRQG
ncbi:MAG: winged helix-turn-helix domain-containing protein [Acidobacteria bacterium]|nr:winged helix-turn-helix domain-containing protein [Acidobacteriota bacterium]